jgi:hypothetical protein
MGQNKNWAIGFFDMQGSGGFSPTMELNLWDGVTEIENLDDEQLASVVKEHEFNAINSESVCTQESECYGWELEGTYTIETHSDESSSVTIEANVRSPTPLNLNGMFGLGWGIEYLDGGDQHTEVTLAMWSYQTELFRNDWAFFSMNSDRSLLEVKEDPTAAQAAAIPEQGLWEVISIEIIGDYDIKIAAIRNFESGIDQARDFRLGQTKDWVVGFFDMTGQTSAFSDTLQLNFDDGIAREHEYTIKTPFVAIPEGEDGPCHKLSNCLGWSVDGEYTVATNFEGQSSLEVEA